MHTDDKELTDLAIKAAEAAAMKIAASYLHDYAMAELKEAMRTRRHTKSSQSEDEGHKMLYCKKCDHTITLAAGQSASSVKCPGCGGKMSEKTGKDKAL